MNSEERVMRALARQPVDRVPNMNSGCIPENLMHLYIHHKVKRGKRK